jgi:hypothetical protein
VRASRGRTSGSQSERAPAVQEPPASEPTHVHSPLHQLRPQPPEGQVMSLGHSLQEGARCPPHRTSGPAKEGTDKGTQCAELCTKGYSTGVYVHMYMLAPFSSPGVFAKWDSRCMRVRQCLGALIPVMPPRQCGCPSASAPVDPSFGL